MSCPAAAKPAQFAAIQADEFNLRAASKESTVDASGLRTGQAVRMPERRFIRLNGFRCQWPLISCHNICAAAAGES